MEIDFKNNTVTRCSGLHIIIVLIADSACIEHYCGFRSSLRVQPETHVHARCVAESEADKYACP